MSEIEVVIDPEALGALPETELRASLTYLAHKTGKPVHFRFYHENFLPSDSLAVVEVVSAGDTFPRDTMETLTIKGRTHKLDARQHPACLAMEDAKVVADDEGHPLARIQQNRLVFLSDITARDNEAARSILAYGLERAADLLDFDVSKVFEHYRKTFTSNILANYRNIVRMRLENRRDELLGLDRSVEDARYTIVDCERRRPVLEAELDTLKRLVGDPHPKVARDQAKSLLGLLRDGTFDSIELADNGDLTAVTSPVTIEHEGYRFPLGAYEVRIDPDGRFRIRNLSEHDRAEFPHPHVSTSGTPCWGNVGVDAAKLVGALRFADVLQLTYRFLSSYNPDGPYEKIGRFDATGEYQDEDEDPCENCDDRFSPFCVQSCEHNQDFGCGDCVEYRTDFCYSECRYNDDWNLIDPCDDCPHGGCIEDECDYFSKRKELGYVEAGK